MFLKRNSRSTGSLSALKDCWTQKKVTAKTAVVRDDSAATAKCPESFTVRKCCRGESCNFLTIWPWSNFSYDRGQIVNILTMTIAKIQIFHGYGQVFWPLTIGEIPPDLNHVSLPYVQHIKKIVFSEVMAHYVSGCRLRIRLSHVDSAGWCYY